MKTEDAFALFEHEYDADVETERLEHFLKAMTTKLITAFSRAFAG
ncbi:hypothetical protein WNY37_05725 [Henriciella sp. AS95]